MGFNIEFPDDFLSDLLDADFGDIAGEALEQASPIMEAAMQSSLRRTIKHDGESELVNSIHASKPKQTKTDAWILSVGPKGTSKNKMYHDSKTHKRTYPVSNALKAIWLEYGIPGQQAPRPFLQSAINDAESRVLAKIQEVYDKKVGGAE